MLRKTTITIKREVNNSNDGNLPSSTISTILLAKRRVVCAEGQGTTAIYTKNGINLNYDYLVYLEPSDPTVLEGDKIEFLLGGVKKVVVKKIRPMTVKIHGNDREVFCTYN